MPLQSDNHVLLAGEPAWPVFLAELRGFLGASAAESLEGTASEAALTPAERDVLRGVAQGLGNAAIARQLGKSEKTVRNQISSIFDKLGVHTRAEAIVRVRDSRARLRPGREPRCGRQATRACPEGGAGLRRLGRSLEPGDVDLDHLQHRVASTRFAWARSGSLIISASTFGTICQLRP